MTYSEKLKDPRWQRKRLEVFSRDNFRCIECGSDKKTLTVHHVFYLAIKAPWEYPEDMLQTFCEDCHFIRQEMIDTASNALKFAMRDIPVTRLDLVRRRIFEFALGTQEGAKHEAL